MIFPILQAILAGTLPSVDYVREVKPLLTARCTSCHGAIRQKAGLRLDTAELIRRGGESGPAVEPGQSGESLLIERVTAADGLGADAARERGNAAELRTRSPSCGPGSTRAHRARPSRSPRTRADTGPISPRLDRAIPRGREFRPGRATRSTPSWRPHIDERGSKPAPPIGKDLWLRRVTLDLIGLPPTRARASEASATTSSPDAEERVVDRLPGQPSIRRALGAALDGRLAVQRLVRTGPGGPLQPPASLALARLDHRVAQRRQGLRPDGPGDARRRRARPGRSRTVRATGFLARNWDIFNRNVWLASTVEHTSRAFLGLTIQCARCHDHKFDPISQADYYRFRAFFEPYHIRIDRVPGEPDRTKAGLPRAFDDFLDRPTYLFVRGDETRPDKSRPLRPATPAVLGGEVRIAPIPLPLAAYCPDKRPFVIDEARAEADRSVAEALKAATAARRRCEQAERELAAARAEDERGRGAPRRRAPASPINVPRPARRRPSSG